MCAISNRSAFIDAESGFVSTAGAKYFSLPAITPKQKVFPVGLHS
jgi:hypothetical protein